jgi:RimJ/RimL family protein N-acetyltransferase
MMIIETKRLWLRTWKQNDVEAYFLINQDPEVIKFLPGSMTLEQVEGFIQGANRHQEELGYTLFAAELKENGHLIGFIGLRHTDFFTKFSAHFAPAVEVGWRLGSQYWNRGYATEGAKAALEYGFRDIGLHEIVSFTVPANLRSIRVMERIGMMRDENGDFAHPKLLPDHPLSKHVLYRIQSPRAGCLDAQKT